MCCQGIPWPEVVPSVLLGLRTTFKMDLQASPAEMVFGTSLRVPGEFFSTHNATTEQPIIVDVIRKPLEPPYTGPHRVVRRMDNRTFIIERNGVERAISTDNLKPAYLDDTETVTESQGETQQSQSSTPRQDSFESFNSPEASLTGGGLAVGAPKSPRVHKRKQLLISIDEF